MNLTFGEVCAGVSGLGAGFERAGFECSWQIEIDKACQSVLKHHYPNAKLYDDATKEGRANLARVRAILGGTPCQGFSIAGLRKGLSDQRSNLCFSFVRICDELDPDVIVWENVPGVLSLEDNAFGCFLAGLAGLDTPLLHPRTEHFARYWREEHCVWPAAGMVAGPKRIVSWRVLDSQYFGVAQRRERVFVVACPNNRVGPLGEGELSGSGFLPGLAAKILFESEMLRRHSPPSREEAKDVAATLGSCTEGSGPRTDPNRMTFVPTHEIAQGIHTRGSKGADSDCTMTLAVSQNLLAGNGTHGNNPLDVPLVIGFEKGRGEHTGDIAGTLRANCGAADGVNNGKADNQCVAFHMQQDPINTEEQAPCIGGQGQAIVAVGFNLHPVHSNAMNSPGPGNAAIPTEVARALDTGGLTVNQGGTVALQPNPLPGVRRLVPVECERIQGFPDDWTRYGVKRDKVVQQKDSPRYRQLGNAVTANVAEWIAQRVRKFGGLND